MTATEHKSYFKVTTNTPYLALTGELWGVYYDNFKENWPRYNGTTLYDAGCHVSIVYGQPSYLYGILVFPDV